MISKFGIDVEQDEGVISMKEITPQNLVINYILDTKDLLIREGLIKLGWIPPEENIDINTKSIYYNGQMRLVRHIKEWLTDEAIDNGWYCDQTVIDMRDCIYSLVKQLELERYIRTSQYREDVCEK